MPQTEIIKWSSDERDLVNGILRIVRTQGLLGQQQQKWNRSAKQSGDIFQRMSGSMSRELGMLILRWASFGSVIALATKGLRELNEERQRSAQRGREGEFQYAKLAQLSIGQPGKLQELIGQSEAIRYAEGLTPQQATDLIFTLESAGIRTTQTVGYFGKLMPILGGLSSEMAENVATLQRAFGRGMAGDVETTMNKLLVASAASKTKLEQFAGPAASAAQYVKRLGGTDVETYAAISQGAFALESADEAATQIRQFAVQANRRGYGGGRGLLAAAADVQQRISEGGNLETLLPETRASGGFEILRDNLEEIRALLKRIDAAGKATGTETDAARQMLREMAQPEVAPYVAAPAAARIAEQRRMQAEEQTSSAQQLYTQTAIDYLDVTMQRRPTGLGRDLPGLSRTANRWMARLVSFVSPAAGEEGALRAMGLPDETVQSVLSRQISVQQAFDSPQFQAWLQGQAQAIEGLTDGVNRLNENLERQNQRRIPVR